MTSCVPQWTPREGFMVSANIVLFLNKLKYYLTTKMFLKVACIIIWLDVLTVTVSGTIIFRSSNIYDIMTFLFFFFF